MNTYSFTFYSQFIHNVLKQTSLYKKSKNWVNFLLPSNHIGTMKIKQLSSYLIRTADRQI